MSTFRHMGNALLRLAACAVFALAFGAPPATAAEHKPYSVWVIGEGEKDGHPTTVRWRDKMPDAEFRKLHPWCVEITWRFQHDARGNVSKDETERALDFDTTLEQELENPETAMQVAGFSDNEHRVWIYYATDRYKIEAALDTLKRNDAALPVTYEAHQDPEWEGLALVLGTVKKE